MKKIFKRLGKWLWNQLVRLITAIRSFLVGVPADIRDSIFQFGAWGKKQLDKRINAFQKERLHSVIFKSDSPEGRRFDQIITWVIVISVLSVIFETVSEFHKTYWWIFFVLEWVVTVIFTVEYILRLYCAKNPLRYATSFFGIVDLLAIIPSYLGFLFIGMQHLIIIRALRLLRVFRIFKMGHFVSEGEVIVNALKASMTKIYVFVSFIVLLAMIIGSLMYIVEGGFNEKLNNIPKGIYWAIVTLTTVGYGDVTPISAFGKFLATIVMIMGYGVIAVPTGIVTAEISGRVMNLKEVFTKICQECGQSEHHNGAEFCHKCGEAL